MNKWQIGDVKITRVVESENAFDMTMLLPDATADNVRKEPWLRPHFSDEAGKLKLSIHALAIESGGRKIIVDTCIGNDKRRAGLQMLHTSFLNDLKAAGFSREAVNVVLCTHLHVDHVGWNTVLEGNRWVPTFPNARYLIGRKEWEHWGPTGDAAIADSVRPIFDGGLSNLVEMDHKLTDEIWLEPTPGHTPGHVSVRISSRGQEAVITGDLMHHPIQCPHPEWLCTFDTDAEQARKTRRAFIDKYANRSVLVFGTHFATPSAGHIRNQDGVYRFEV